VNDRCFRAIRSEKMLRFTNAFPTMTMASVPRPVLLEQFVHPSVDVLVLVAKQSLTVPTMVFELCHIV